MSKDRRKQQKQAQREKERKERGREIEARRRRLPDLAVELSIPYEKRYPALVAEALAKHPDLLGVFDCGDDVFYDPDRSAPLRHAGLGHWTRVFLSVTDGIDFSTDPGTSPDGIVNERMSRPGGKSLSGITCILTNGEARRYAIFMRATVGGDGEPVGEADHAFRIAGLLHELGHVLDYEQQINCDMAAGTLDLVRAETFAHRHACEEMIRRNLRMLLKNYLEHLEEAATSHPSEYVRLATRALVRSSDFARYKAEVRGVP